MREARWIETHGQQQLMASAYPLNPRAALGLQHHTSIAFDREMRKQPRFLNHITNAAAKSDQVRVANRLSIHQHFAARRQNHAVHGPQQSGLSRSAAPQQYGRGSRFDQQRNVCEQSLPLRGRNRDCPKLNRCAHVNPISVRQGYKAPSRSSGTWSILDAVPTHLN